MEKGKSLGNTDIKEAIQESKFDDGNFKMIVWEIRKNTGEWFMCGKIVRDG